MAHQELPYDSSDKSSIVSYAQGLVGRTLRDLRPDLVVEDMHVRRGSFGNAVETYYFGLEPNNDPRPDFYEADLELKTTPLKQLKNGRLAAKERLVLGMIDYNTVVNEEFESSHLAQKAKNILLISYLWEKDKDPVDYKVLLADVIEPTDGDIEQFKRDWETVVGKVRDGRAHEISGSDTLYLEACTKSSDSSVRRKQPFSDIGAKPRAWALKASYMTAMQNGMLEHAQSIQRADDERNLSLLELVRRRFSPYVGKSQDELAQMFDYATEGRRAPKNLCALITRKILGVSDDSKIAEFEKAGIMPKTIRLKRSGRPKEALSFPRFDYMDFVTVDFDSSDFHERLQQRYLFVIYREDEEGEYRLSDVCFWQMPDDDIDEAGRCYETFRQRVLSGHAEDSVKSSENRVAHVRPHARNNEDTCMTPYGVPVVKKCFWLNQDYLAGQIREALEAEGD